MQMKILLYTDLDISPDQLFWHRDLGLLTKAFRSLGHDAYLVVHLATEPSPAPDSCSHSEIRNSKSPLPPVLWPSPSDVRDPLWWQSHKPDLVILGLWTRPKYDPVRRAALSATPHVIERADSDGMRTASCSLLTYAKRRFDYFRDRSYHWPSPLSIPASIFYSFASIIATPWIEFRLRKTLELLPSVLVETPHATNLWKSLATRLEADPSKIQCVPHPIQTDIFKLDPAIQKKNQIISVGRWDSYQKNLPFLLKNLRVFLDKHPTWTSLMIGSGLPTKSPHPQITFLSPLPPPDIARHMQESKIFLFSSRYESFGLAAAEAAACGCALAGPSEILSHCNESTFFNIPSYRLLEKLSDGPFLFCNHPSRPLSSVTTSEIAQQIIRLSQSIL
jgi:glycosyltransferase involved in cell wall biosynthesis